MYILKKLEFNYMSHQTGIWKFILYLTRILNCDIVRFSFIIKFNMCIKTAGIIFVLNLNYLL